MELKSSFNGFFIIHNFRNDVQINFIETLILNIFQYDQRNREEKKMQKYI